ncbi:hypothetical protein M378DRAFT_657582 [Amanita muscaria Koide BX008]|uniref:DUF2470 domain-containing protein n=1 Tax=Amanita muscaria (strain Koide BX008) TaxID=946122 RepID=A0A0C2X4V7_AMAMK|nr:hypothetical protein M378DRAFT_657582 [Amanita muscaria Koide BX008]
MAGDPVAEKSTFLRMYMSNHPDTLVAYAKYYGKVDAPIVSAEMTAISTKTMTILCTLKSGGKQPTTITFTPPLAGYDAVKPRLLEMKAIAQEKLGMIKAPHITSFEWPNQAYPSLLVVSTVAFFYFFPEAKLAQPVLRLVGYESAKRGFQITVFLHVLESLYMLSLCRKHITGFGVGALYVGSTFLCGFPIVMDLRRRVQKARIDSVMKVQ